ncbi:MAG: hypothetical protein EA424_04130 [Planctomycetaceae bacterium]|nr:MAG: hypothetical protein EA424_04130 [Planctomycetaceae bacterium]
MTWFPFDLSWLTRNVRNNTVAYPADRQDVNDAPFQATAMPWLHDAIEVVMLSLCGSEHS